MGKKKDLKRIARFTLFGAVGFGIGTIGFHGEPIGGWFMHLKGESLPWLPGFAILGAAGGIALRLALGDWGKFWVSGLIGAIGFLLGTIIPMFILTITLIGFRGDFSSIIIFGAMPGAIGGAALGLDFGGWRAFKGLALAGASGFGIGMLIISTTPLDSWLGWVLWGIIGGALLGFVLGLLEMDIKKSLKPLKGEGDTFNYNTKECPYCNNPDIERSIIHRVKTKKERKKLGYSIKWQLECLRCKLKWVVLEK